MRRRIEGPRCSMGSIFESSDVIVGKTPESLTKSWNRSAQSTCGCTVGDLMSLELSTTHRPCSRRSGGAFRGPLRNRAKRERRRPDLRLHSRFSGWNMKQDSQFSYFNGGMNNMSGYGALRHLRSNHGIAALVPPTSLVSKGSKDEQVEADRLRQSGRRKRMRLRARRVRWRVPTRSRRPLTFAGETSSPEEV